MAIKQRNGGTSLGVQAGEETLEEGTLFAWAFLTLSLRKKGGLEHLSAQERKKRQMGRLTCPQEGGKTSL